MLGSTISRQPMSDSSSLKIWGERVMLLSGAGSERQKVTEGEGERLKEAGSINRSLASLGLVIKKLVEGNGPGPATNQAAHIPYRDSRLTFLLQVLAC